MKKRVLSVWAFVIRCKSRSHKTGNEYEILVWNVTIQCTPYF